VVSKFMLPKMRQATATRERGVACNTQQAAATGAKCVFWLTLCVLVPAKKRFCLAT